MSQTFLFATWSLSLEKSLLWNIFTLCTMDVATSLLAAKQDLGRWRVLILYSLFFFSLSTLSCLSVCALLNCWFSRLCEPCLELQDATPHELVTNVLLSLAYFSRVLKKKAAFAYPHNFTQYSVWHIGFFIRFIKADIFPMDKKILLVIPLCPHSLVHTQLCQCSITWVIQL